MHSSIALSPDARATTAATNDTSMSSAAAAAPTAVGVSSPGVVVGAGGAADPSRLTGSAPLAPAGAQAAVFDAAAISQQALMLQAGVLSHQRLAVSAAHFVTELGAAYGCSRVTLGFVQRGSVELAAVSHGSGEQWVGEAFDLIVAAMDEAVQQACSVQLPAPSGSRSLIRIAHARWLQRQGGSLLSVPLLHAGEVVGALSCEWLAVRDDGAQPVAALESVLSLVGPVLHLMHLRELPLRTRFMDAAGRLWQRLSTLEDPRVRWGAAAATLALVSLCAVPVDYRVGGKARIEGENQRALVAPTDGFLKAVHVRPGDRVKAGQVLIEMAEQDMTLERRKWASELGQQDSAYATALSRADRAAMVTALARAEQARAQLAVIDGELARAVIVAPFDGVVIQGDLGQSVGSPLERGKPLMLIAPGEAFRVVVEIDERDVAQVAPGQPGALSVSALPWESLPIEVTRVTPIAHSVEGNNVFEVEASVAAGADRIRPGLEGVAKITVGERSLAWAATHRLIDRLRIAAWSWWGG